jgi:hypothetical protein
MIPLPPKGLDDTKIEEEFLTPSVYVASMPLRYLKRPEMKRTISELSNWEGDESTSSSEPNDKLEGNVCG